MIAIFLMMSMNVTGQSTVRCECEGIVDIDFRGFILLYDKPNGKIIKRLKHNIKKEDYLVFDIDRSSDSFFHIKIQNSFSGNTYRGWVRKTKQLTTFVRNYSSSVNLYFKPAYSSRINSTFSNKTSPTFQITSCKGKWLKLKELGKSTVGEGWIESKDQCANPYTTCS